MSSLEQTAFVAELINGVRTMNKHGNKLRLTTFPGLRFERRQVEVSVVQQLKQRRRMPSVSFVLASEVCTMLTGGWPGMG